MSLGWTSSKQYVLHTEPWKNSSTQDEVVWDFLLATQLPPSITMMSLNWMCGLKAESLVLGCRWPDAVFAEIWLASALVIDISGIAVDQELHCDSVVPNISGLWPFESELHLSGEPNFEVLQSHVYYKGRSDYKATKLSWVLFEVLISILWFKHQKNTSFYTSSLRLLSEANNRSMS